VKLRITKVIVCARERAQRNAKQAVCLSTTKRIIYPLGNALSFAQNDHFRYPQFHFCHPLKPWPFNH